MVLRHIHHYERFSHLGCNGAQIPCYFISSIASHLTAINTTLSPPQHNHPTTHQHPSPRASQYNIHIQQPWDKCCSNCNMYSAIVLCCLCSALNEAAAESIYRTYL
jgi:hypothetical protein